MNRCLSVLSMLAATLACPAQPGPALIDLPMKVEGGSGALAATAAGRRVSGPGHPVPASHASIR